MTFYFLSLSFITHGHAHDFFRCCHSGNSLSGSILTKRPHSYFSGMISKRTRSHLLNDHLTTFVLHHVNFKQPKPALITSIVALVAAFTRLEVGIFNVVYIQP